MTKKRKGFTLTELLVVIAILAIISTVTIIGYTHFIKKAAISKDTIFAKQLNTLLKGEGVYTDINDDNSIAKFLQNNINRNISIETEKYDMNIFFNKTSKTFEVLSNSDATNYDYKPLNYYLQLTTFHIDTTYFEEFQEITTFESNKERLKAYIQNNALYVTIFEDESGNIKTNDIDLTKIVTATDSDGNLVELSFESNATLNGSSLNESEAGKYIIKYSVADLEFSMDLYIKNAYYSKDAEINTEKLNYIITKNNDKSITINISNLIYGIAIKDYGLYSDDFVELSERKELISKIYLIIEINEQTQEIPLSIEKNAYTVNLQSITVGNNPIINISFKYQGYNGVYCYSEPKIISME